VYFAGVSPSPFTCWRALERPSSTSSNRKQRGQDLLRSHYLPQLQPIVGLSNFLQPYSDKYLYRLRIGRSLQSNSSKSGQKELSHRHRSFQDNFDKFPTSRIVLSRKACKCRYRVGILQNKTRSLMRLYNERRLMDKRHRHYYRGNIPQRIQHMCLKYSK